MWAVHWSAHAIRGLARLDDAAANRVAAKVEAASADPERHFHRLRGAEEWKLRVGDYRVIAYLERESRRISISKVGHRSIVYR